MLQYCVVFIIFLLIIFVIYNNLVRVKNKKLLMKQTQIEQQIEKKTLNKELFFARGGKGGLSVGPGKKTGVADDNNCSFVFDDKCSQSTILYSDDATTIVHQSISQNKVTKDEVKIGASTSIKARSEGDDMIVETEVRSDSYVAMEKSDSGVKLNVRVGSTYESKTKFGDDDNHSGYSSTSTTGVYVDGQTGCVNNQCGVRGYAGAKSSSETGFIGKATGEKGYVEGSASVGVGGLGGGGHATGYYEDGKVNVSLGGQICLLICAEIMLDFEIDVTDLEIGVDKTAEYAEKGAYELANISEQSFKEAIKIAEDGIDLAKNTTKVFTDVFSSISCSDNRQSKGGNIQKNYESIKLYTEAEKIQENINKYIESNNLLIKTISEKKQNKYELELTDKIADKEFCYVIMNLNKLEHISGVYIKENNNNYPTLINVLISHDNKSYRKILENENTNINEKNKSDNNLIKFEKSEVGKYVKIEIVRYVNNPSLRCGIQRVVYGGTPELYGLTEDNELYRKDEVGKKWNLVNTSLTFKKVENFNKLYIFGIDSLNNLHQLTKPLSLTNNNWEKMSKSNIKNMSSGLNDLWIITEDDKVFCKFNSEIDFKEVNFNNLFTNSSSNSIKKIKKINAHNLDYVIILAEMDFDTALNQNETRIFITAKPYESNSKWVDISDSFYNNQIKDIGADKDRMWMVDENNNFYRTNYLIKLNNFKLNKLDSCYLNWGLLDSKGIIHYMNIKNNKINIVFKNKNYVKKEDIFEDSVKSYNLDNIQFKNIEVLDLDNNSLSDLNLENTNYLNTELNLDFVSLINYPLIIEIKFNVTQDSNTFLKVQRYRLNNNNDFDYLPSLTNNYSYGESKIICKRFFNKTWGWYKFNYNKHKFKTFALGPTQIWMYCNYPALNYENNINGKTYSELYNLNTQPNKITQKQELFRGLKQLKVASSESRDKPKNVNLKFKSSENYYNYDILKIIVDSHDENKVVIITKAFKSLTNLNDYDLKIFRLVNNQTQTTTNNTKFFVETNYEQQTQEQQITYTCEEIDLGSKLNEFKNKSLNFIINDDILYFFEVNKNIHKNFVLRQYNLDTKIFSEEDENIYTMQQIFDQQQDLEEDEILKIQKLKTNYGLYIYVLTVKNYLYEVKVNENSIKLSNLTQTNIFNTNLKNYIMNDDLKNPQKKIIDFSINNYGDVFFIEKNGDVYKSKIELNWTQSFINDDSSLVQENKFFNLICSGYTKNYALLPNNNLYVCEKPYPVNWFREETKDLNNENLTFKSISSGFNCESKYNVYEDFDVKNIDRSYSSQYNKNSDTMLIDQTTKFTNTEIFENVASESDLNQKSVHFMLNKYFIESNDQSEIEKMIINNEIVKPWLPKTNGLSLDVNDLELTQSSEWKTIKIENKLPTFKLDLAMNYNIYGIQFNQNTFESDFNIYVSNDDNHYELVEKNVSYKRKNIDFLKNNINNNNKNGVTTTSLDNYREYNVRYLLFEIIEVKNEFIPRNIGFGNTDNSVSLTVKTIDSFKKTFSGLSINLKDPYRSNFDLKINESTNTGLNLLNFNLNLGSQIKQVVILNNMYYFLSNYSVLSNRITRKQVQNSEKSNNNTLNIVDNSKKKKITIKQLSVDIENLYILIENDIYKIPNGEWDVLDKKRMGIETDIKHLNKFKINMDSRLNNITYMCCKHNNYIFVINNKSEVYFYYKKFNIYNAEGYFLSKLEELFDSVYTKYSNFSKQIENFCCKGCCKWIRKPPIPNPVDVAKQAAKVAAKKMKKIARDTQNTFKQVNKSLNNLDNQLQELGKDLGDDLDNIGTDALDGLKNATEAIKNAFENMFCKSNLDFDIDHSSLAKLKKKNKTI